MCEWGFVTVSTVDRAISPFSTDDRDTGATERLIFSNCCNTMTLTCKIDTVVARGPDVMYAKFYGITVLLTCIAVQ